MTLHLSPRGFTLVELLVTMAIFMSVLTIAVGALFSAQVVNTRLEQTQSVLDGVNLATEVIIRDIRYGSQFYCATVLPNPAVVPPQECTYPTSGTVLVFRPTIALPGTTDPDNDRVAYYLSNGMIYKNIYPYGGVMQTQQISSNDVDIDKLAFYSEGLKPSTGAGADNNQPLITMVLAGLTIPRKATAEPVSFSVQTSGSSRTLDR